MFAIKPGRWIQALVVGYCLCAEMTNDALVKTRWHARMHRVQSVLRLQRSMGIEPKLKNLAR